MRQSLPIYSRTRTAGQPARASAYGHVPAPADYAHSPRPFLPAVVSPYRVSTLAGKADTVWHQSSLSPRKPLPVPVWRSGYKDGTAARALFNKPTGLAVDRRGYVYVSDSLNHCIRRISPSGKVSTLAGNGERGHHDASGRRARFNHPTGLALSARNELYIVDQGNATLRCLLPGGQVLSLAPAGKPLGGIAIDPRGWVYLLLELNIEGRPKAVLGRFDSATGITLILAEWEGELQWLPYRRGEEQQPFSRWWLRRSHRPQMLEIAEASQAEGLGLALDVRGNLHWLAGSQLYRLDTLAGSGADNNHMQLQRQSLKLPLWPLARWQGLTVEADGTVHVIDARHHSVYRIAPGSSSPECVLDAEGLSQPYSVVSDGYGQLYVSDTGHWRVCRLVPPGRESLLRLARLAFLPYLPAPAEHSTAAKGIQDVVHKHLRRKSPGNVSDEGLLPVVAEQHVLAVLDQGNRSQKLAVVKELVDQLKAPTHRSLAPLQPVVEAMLAHGDASVRTLLIRHICDTVHSEHDALFWIAVLDHHHEPNRLLKKYLIEVLSYFGKRYELYGHVVPLMVEYIRAEQEDVVEYVFQHLLSIRRAGYESLVDPLIEELSEA